MLARKLLSITYCLTFLAAVAVTSTANAASKEVVEFRLTKWKSAHFDSEKDSQKVYETLKQLGCEARMHAHDGHTDVTYRCMSWKTISSKTHEEAAKWDKWFQAYGFETRHSH